MLILGRKEYKDGYFLKCCDFRKGYKDGCFLKCYDLEIGWVGKWLNEKEKF